MQHSMSTSPKIYSIPSPKKTISRTPQRYFLSIQNELKRRLPSRGIKYTKTVTKQTPLKTLKPHFPPPTTTGSRREPLNPHTKRNTLIGAESSESSSRIRWRKSPNPQLHSFSEVILTSKPFSYLV